MALLSRWWLLVTIPTLLGLAGYFYSERQDPVYEAKATILVKGRGGGLTVGAVDFRLSSDLAATYSKKVTSKPFLEQVELDGVVPFAATSLQNMVSASTDNNPPVVQLRVRHRDPNIAATVAQIVSEQFIDFTIEQKLADIARMQTAAAAQGISNTDSLVAAQFSALDTLELLEPGLHSR